MFSAGLKTVSPFLWHSSICTNCVAGADHSWDEKHGTPASHNCTKDSSLCKFLGAAFSLIVIMLQANFLD